MKEIQNDFEELDSDEYADHQDPVLGQYQTEQEQEHWTKQLHASRQERKAFDSDAVKALARYKDQRDEYDEDAKYYNIFYNVVDMKMSALYARTPQPDISPRFKDANDHPSRVACALLQRSISYELDRANFNSTFKQILFDRLVPGQGVGWVRLDHQEQHAEGVVDPFSGALIQPTSVVVNQEACIDYVAWDDFLWAPCKYWTLCGWVARRIPMSKQSIKDRFSTTAPQEVLDELVFSEATPSNDRISSLQVQHKTTKTVDVYEIWDKERKVIFWIAESAQVPLDVQADTNEFDDFFPTPMPPLGRYDNNNAQPISDYHQARSKYIELDALNDRRAKLREAISVKFVYDKTNEALKDLYTIVGDNEGIGVDNMDAFNAKGGMQGSIHFAPIAEPANVHALMSSELEKIKNEIYELEGISDIARGLAAPYETATATSAKASLSANRIVQTQQDVARYIEQLMKLKAHVISKFYEPQFLLKRAGALPLADQQYIPAALQLLRDEQLSSFRLSVSVDSIQMENWQNEKDQRTAAIHATVTAAQQLLPIAERFPSFAPSALELIKMTVSGFRGAQGFMGTIDHALQQLAQEAAHQQGQPPKPSPEQIKAQAQQHKAQVELQIAQMEHQHQMAMAQMQAQIKAQIAQLEHQRAESELRIRELEAMVKAKQLDATIAHNQATASHHAAMDLINLSKGAN